MFDVVPTACDVHYNQANLRKVGKKGLKKTISKNAEFKAWVHQIMSLNHLPSDKIEQTFRELCAIHIPLSASAKKEKQSFQRYWERFWLGTIGVERISVYNAPLRTNNHCESYHAKLPSQIGVRPNFWIFVRQINRILDIIDINMERLDQQTAFNRVQLPNPNNKKIEALTTRLESSQIAPLDFVKAIAHLKSKVKDVGDVDSDSDSEIEEEEEGGSEEPPAAEPQAENPQIANPQEDANSCKVCLDAPIDTIMLPCRHTACYTQENEESLPLLPRSDPTTDPILYQLDHALGFEYMTDVTLIVIEIINIL